MPVHEIAVNGVYREIAVGTLDVKAVVNGVPTLQAVIKSADASYRPTTNMEVIWSVNGTPTFGGVIVKTREMALTGHGVPIQTEITSHGFGVYAKRRTVSGFYPEQTRKARLTSIVATYYSGFGISIHASQPDGPTLPATTYDHRGDELLTILAGEDSVWQINADKKLLMAPPSFVAATFNISPNDGNVIGDLVVETNDEEPVNRVVISGGQGFRELFNERYYGDGSTHEFPLRHPLDHSNTELRIYIGGVFQEIVTWAGNHPDDLPQAEWSYDPLTWTIHQRSDLTPLGASDYFETDYRAFYYHSGQVDTFDPTQYTTAPWTFVVEDLTDQGLVGIFEKTLYYQDVFSKDELLALGAQVLRPSTDVPKRVEYLTHTPGLWISQEQHIDEPYRNIDADILITEVNVRDVVIEDGDDFLLEYQVIGTTRGKFDGSFRDTYVEWWEGRRAPVVPADASLPAAAAGPIHAVQFKGRDGLFAGNEFIRVSDKENSLRVGNELEIFGCYNLAVGDSHLLGADF